MLMSCPKRAHIKVHVDCRMARGAVLTSILKVTCLNFSL